MLRCAATVSSTSNFFKHSEICNLRLVGAASRQTTIAGADPQNTRHSKKPRTCLAYCLSNHMGMARPSLFLPHDLQNILQRLLTRQPCLRPPCLRHHAVAHKSRIFCAPSAERTCSRLWPTCTPCIWASARVSWRCPNGCFGGSGSIFPTFFSATTVGAAVFAGGGGPLLGAAPLVAIWHAVALAPFSDLLNVLVLQNVLHCLKVLLRSQDAVVDVHDLLVTLRHISQQRLLRNTRDRLIQTRRSSICSSVG